MKADYETDISDLVASRELPPMGDAPPLPGMDPAARVFSRVAATSELLRGSREAVDAICKSTGFKAANVLAILATLVTVGLQIFGVL